MRRAFRARRAKRSVAWIPGFSTFDDTNGTSNRLLTFAQVPTVALTWGVASMLTTDTDLSLHGGEDAVLTRIRGQLGFVEGRKNAGAGLAAYGFQVRVVIALSEIQSGLGAAAPLNDSFLTSNALGQDRIMWSKETVVSPTAIGAAGAGYELMTGRFTNWLEIDVRAQRKLASDSQVVMYLQTILPAGSTGADMRCIGGLRMLVKRPR